MNENTDYTARLDELQDRVARAKAAARSAVAESDVRLRERIDRAQAELDRSGQHARQHAGQAAGRGQAKWAQLRSDVAARTSGVKAKVDQRARQMDVTMAAADADWAEADAYEALDFADWAVENAQLAMLDAIHARAHADDLGKAAANS
jgi:hypothetical protein